MKLIRKKERMNEVNKAGYTVNTSRGGVGRGGNACFPTFRLERDGPTDRPTDQRTNRRTDKAYYRVACPRLKMLYQNGKKIK